MVSPMLIVLIDLEAISPDSPHKITSWSERLNPISLRTTELQHSTDEHTHEAVAYCMYSILQIDQFKYQVYFFISEDLRYQHKYDELKYAR